MDEGNKARTVRKQPQFITYITAKSNRFLYIIHCFTHIFEFWLQAQSTVAPTFWRQNLEWTMSDMVKYRAALLSFLKLTALVFYHV